MQGRENMCGTKKGEEWEGDLTGHVSVPSLSAVQAVRAGKILAPPRMMTGSSYPFEAKAYSVSLTGCWSSRMSHLDSPMSASSGGTTPAGYVRQPSSPTTDGDGMGDAVLSGTSVGPVARDSARV